MKFTPMLKPATKTIVMIKPTESVREIERGLYESKFWILSPHYLVTAVFDPSVEWFINASSTADLVKYYENSSFFLDIIGRSMAFSENRFQVSGVRFQAGAHFSTTDT